MDWIKIMCNILDHRKIKMIEIGWSGIWVAWHYVVFGLLFGVVIGWPLSELAGRQSAIEEASKKAKIEYQRYKMDLIEKECRAVEMIRNAYAFKIESQKLKEEVKRMRGEIFVRRQSAKEQIQDNEELLRNAISVEKELVKAKAKIRRLTSKSNHQAKNSIDGGQYTSEKDDRCFFGGGQYAIKRQRIYLYLVRR